MSRIGFLLSLLTLLPPVSRADACSCGTSGPPCQAYFSVDAVFVGRVESISEIPMPEQPVYRAHLVRFQAERAFRGVDPGPVEVVTGLGGGDCGYSFEVGKQYLVYAYRGRSTPHLGTGICTRTRPLASADEDLRFITELPATGPGARVFGTVTHWERDFATGMPVNHGPLPGVRIVLNGGDHPFEATTTESGRYEIAKVPPGSYRLDAVPPPAFSTTYLTTKLDIADPRACAAYDFGIRLDGRISGTAVDSDGHPVVGASIEVMAAGHAGEESPAEKLKTMTDAAGHYEFTALSPGRYVVGVGLRREIEHGPVYPRTFHPGTDSAAAATVVQVGDGTRHTLPVFHLPPARAARVLTGQVVWPDGTPATGAFISLSDGLVRWRQVAMGTRVDSDGRFTFTVFEGLSYIVHSWADVPGASPSKQAREFSEPFVANANMAPLRLVLLVPDGPR